MATEVGAKVLPTAGVPSYSLEESGRPPHAPGDGAAMPKESSIQGKWELTHQGTQGALLSGWAEDTANPTRWLAIEVWFNSDLVGRGVSSGAHDLGSFAIRLARGGLYRWPELRVIVNDCDLGMPDRINDVAISSACLVGALTSVERSGDEIAVEGWAVDLSTPNGKVAIFASVGDQEFCTFADKPSSDTPVSSISDGCFGFRFSLISVGSESPVVRFSDGTPVPFFGGLLMDASSTPIRRQLQASEPDGLTAALEVDGDLVRGWVADRGSDLPLDVEVRSERSVIWSGAAARLETRSLNDEGPRAPHGFRVLLPRPERPVLLRSLEIITSDGRLLPGGRFYLKDGSTLRGRVETVTTSSGGISIQGWAVDIQRPSRPLRLRAVDREGRIVGSAQARGSRPDLKDTLGIDIPFGGFALELPSNVEVAWPVQLVVEGTLRIVPPGALSAPALQSTIDEETPRFAGIGSRVAGRIERVTTDRVRGWARDVQGLSTVFVDLMIDDIWVATTAANQFRADLARRFGDHGYHEFRFELTPSQTWQSPGRISVKPRLASGSIKPAQSAKLEEPFAQAKRNRLRHPGHARSYLVVKNSWSNAAPSGKFSIIVLNRNGANLLDRLFRSFLDCSSYRNLEFIVVDHGSRDGSHAVCERWSTEFEMIFLDRGANYSFSDSNNYGAARSKGDYLLFLNNDARLSEDLLGHVARHLEDRAVGVVGIGLEDDLPSSTLSTPGEQRPVQHLGVHLRLKAGANALHPYETRLSEDWTGLDRLPIRSPVVTGAFMAIRRETYDDLGGFDTRYHYGYEDVDLCLRAREKGLEIVCLNDVRALHLRGYSRDSMGSRFDPTRRRNHLALDARFGSALRRALARDRFTKPGFWSGRMLRVAFVVTQNDPNTLAGDYFTAYELAEALSAQFPVDCVFLEHNSEALKNLVGVDVLISMRDDFDPRQVAGHEPNMLRIAWVRNWFERFAQRPFVQDFDALWAASQTGAEIVTAATGLAVEVVRIASNLHRFGGGTPQEEFVSDYCFTGSYWGVNREILQMLDPSALPYRFLLIGQGWERMPKFAPYARGPVPYSRMPEVYASTRLVIDDANHVTREAGSVNSRVFDALASGCLVVTNSVLGSAEVFGGHLPTYSSPQELEDLLSLYLSDEQRRTEKVRELKDLVVREHSYDRRARTCWADFRKLSARTRIAIKIATPRRENFQTWGDYHFANSLKAALEKLGYGVRIDALAEWDNPASNADDAVLVIRGLSSYIPKVHQVNLIWVISHPDGIADAELAAFDHVYVASQPYAVELSRRLDRDVTPLLQCTDPALFNPDVGPATNGAPLLFVGNSREVLRPIVRDVIAMGLTPEVWGTRWQGLIPERFVKGENISNRELAKHYRAASVVLNDHWAKMRQHGFISNRVFDVLACGGRLLSDPVEGLAEMFGHLVDTYAEPSELPAKITALSSEDESRRIERDTAAREIGLAHSFDARAAEISARLEKILAERNALKVA